MSILELQYVVDRWSQCCCCTRVAKPAISAYDRSAHSTGTYCYRCYHTLAAVQLTEPKKEGGTVNGNL
jgi:hypothetical protein